MGRVGSQTATNSRLGGLHSLVGSEDLWGTKRGGGRMKTCEQSSLSEVSWVRSIIPCASPQLSDTGSSFLSGCLSTSSIHQTSTACHGKWACLFSNYYVIRTPPASPCLRLAVFPFWEKRVALGPALSGHTLLVLPSHGGGAQTCVWASWEVR